MLDLHDIFGDKDILVDHEVNCTIYQVLRSQYLTLDISLNEPELSSYLHVVD